MAGTVLTEGAGAVAAKFLEPEIVVGGACLLGTVALVYGGHELYKHAGSWIHAKNVVMHPDKYNAAEITKSHKEIQGFGAGSLNFAAGSISAIGISFGLKRLGAAGQLS